MDAYEEDTKKCPCNVIKIYPKKKKMVWGRWTVSKLGDSCLSVLEVSPSLPPYLKTYHCRWLLELQTWMQSYELKMDASSST